ncbi:MAG: hypothetical protein R6U42_00385, partial [Halomonas sp.]
LFLLLFGQEMFLNFQFQFLLYLFLDLFVLVILMKRSPPRPGRWPARSRTAGKRTTRNPSRIAVAHSAHVVHASQLTNNGQSG